MCFIVLPHPIHHFHKLRCPVSPGGYPVVEYREQAVCLSLNIIIQISHFSKPGFNNKEIKLMILD